jgi:nicotinamidase-related amidase
MFFALRELLERLTRRQPAPASLDAIQQHRSPANPDETTLVIVDMQPYFRASQHPDTLAAVEREIRSAISNESAIVLLEFEDSGDTDARLMRVLRAYPRLAVKLKTTDDGSAWVTAACREHGFGTKHFRVCGVNTDACVLATVLGLTRRLPHCTVEVVKDACNSGNTGYNWGDYRNQRNVVVLG